jgi:hypothetical protein
MTVTLQAEDHVGAWREVNEAWQSATANLASLDQELAEAKSRRLQCVVSATDATVCLEKNLVKKLVIGAQVTEFLWQLTGQNSENRTPEEEAAIARLRAVDVPDRLSLDNDARRFVAGCAEAIELCVQWTIDCIDDEDLIGARGLLEQAHRLTVAMRAIQNAWPWLDEQGARKSWQQYHEGTLMDFETFKHELLKAAK